MIDFRYTCGRTAFMTEAEWSTCNNPKEMLIFLTDQGKVSERQYRLFSCACFRRVWDALTDLRARKAVEVAERYSDGVADDAEREQALEEVAGARPLSIVTARWAVVAVARTAAMMSVDVAGQIAACPPGQEYAPEPWASETLKQCDLLRDIVGPLPFRSVVIAPHWRTPEVIGLAQAIYEERGFDRMLALGQALYRAGCCNREILHHCLWFGEHTRGCWVIDLVLDKQDGGVQI